MLESGDLDPGLPLTFVRGYIRNYSKLLSIPDNEVKLALEALQPKPVTEETAPTPMQISGPAATTDSSMPVSFGNFFMQLFTYLLAITVIGLVGIWWHTQKTNEPNTAVQEQTVTPAPTAEIIQPPTLPPVLGPLTRAENAAGPDMQDTKSAATEIQAIAKPAAPAQPEPAAPAQAKMTKGFIGEYSIQILSGFILLLVISAIGYHLYGKSTKTKTPKHMASARLNRTPARKQRAHSVHWPKPSLPKFSLPRFKLPGFSLPRFSLPRFSLPRFSLPHLNLPRFSLPKLHLPKVKLPKAITSHQTMVFFGVIVVISIAGIGNSLWHKQSNHKTPVITAAKTPAAAVAVPRQEEMPVEFTIDLNIEPLATPNLDNYVQANLKLNALYAMAYQLKDLTNQAAAVKFALTDKSMPLGQLKKVKKSHKYHRPAYVNFDYANQNNSNNPVVQ